MKLRVFQFFAVLAISIFIISCSTSVTTMKIEPKSNNFGPVNIGSNATFDFVITNNKSIDVTVSTLTFSAIEFKEAGATLVGQSIPGKSSKTLSVEFEPALPAGTKVATLTIDWTDINGKTGTLKVNLSGEAVAAPKIEITPTLWDFGIVLIGQSASYDFDIENNGTADLNISAYSFTANATNFSISSGGTLPMIVAPGATHTITVEFSPLIAGTLDTTLELTHNAVNVVPPFVIDISAEGTAWAPEITLNQTSPWDFGQVNTGSTSTQDLEISSSGLNALVVTSATLTTGTFFTVASVKDSNGTPVNLPQTITVGDYITVEIEFSPVAGSIYNDTLSIVHDGVNANSPIDISITGTGRAPITRTFTYTGAAQNWVVPNGVTQVRALVVGGGGGGSGSHYGAGGSGWVEVDTINVSGTIQVTVGNGGTGGITSTNDSPGGVGGTSSFGTHLSAQGGGGGGSWHGPYQGGGAGGSGGGGGGNMGYGGNGGSAGANGDRGNTYPGGMGGHFDALTGFRATLTAGTGGNAGTSSHAGGGGAGGVLIGGNGPSAGDGGQSWSGKGGRGYGSGGGSGGYSGGTRPGGGIGAHGVIYIEY